MNAAVQELRLLDVVRLHKFVLFTEPLESHVETEMSGSRKQHICSRFCKYPLVRTLLPPPCSPFSGKPQPVVPSQSPVDVSQPSMLHNVLSSHEPSSVRARTASHPVSSQNYIQRKSTPRSTKLSSSMTRMASAPSPSLTMLRNPWATLYSSNSLPLAPLFPKEVCRVTYV